MFQKAALIGIGLIGSSLSHAMRRANLAATITASARTGATRATARRLGSPMRCSSTRPMPSAAPIL